MEVSTAAGTITVTAEKFGEEDIISILSPSGDAICEVRITNEGIPEIDTFVYHDGEESPSDVFAFNRE